MVDYSVSINIAFLSIALLVLYLVVIVAFLLYTNKNPYSKTKEHWIDVLINFMTLLVLLGFWIIPLNMLIFYHFYLTNG